MQINILLILINYGGETSVQIFCATRSLSMKSCLKRFEWTSAVGTSRVNAMPRPWVFAHLCQLVVASRPLIQQVRQNQRCRLNVRTHAAEKREIENVVWLRDPSGMLWSLVC